MRNFSDRFVLSSKLLCVILLFFTCLNQVLAQEAAPEKKWNFLTDVYLMFPYMNGETGIGKTITEITVPVDANPGDIFSKLKLAGMLYLEAHTSKWAITSDFIYMDLKQDVTSGKIINSGDVSVSQLAWEPAGLYRLNSFLEVGAGGRLNSLSTDISLLRNVFPKGTESVSESASKTWFDPILIARASTDINDKWLFQFRADIGGFGMGSDFAWQLQAYAGYRFTKLFQVTAGYRYLSMDYDKGESSTRFIYNMDTFGPVIRMGFNF
jgi:hypothetical protein